MLKDLVELIDQYEAAGKAVKEKIGIIYFPNELMADSKKLAELINENKLTVRLENFSDLYSYKVHTKLGIHDLYAIYSDKELKECFPVLRIEEVSLNEHISETTEM